MPRDLAMSATITVNGKSVTIPLDVLTEALELARNYAEGAEVDDADVVRFGAALKALESLT